MTLPHEPLWTVPATLSPSEPMTRFESRLLKVQQRILKSLNKGNCGTRARVFANRSSWKLPELAESAAWDLQWVFRSEDLRPETASEIPEDPSLMNFEALIAQALLQLDQMPLPEHPLSQSGRLLLCYYEQTNHNGLTQILSDGYFDFFDNPPWDTWVDHQDGALIAWVPADLIEMVDTVIQDECVGMLMWMDHPRRSLFDRKPPSHLNEFRSHRSDIDERP